MAQLNYDNNTQSNIRIGNCSRCNNQIQNPAKSKRPETLVCKNCVHFERYNESLFETEQRKLRAKQLEYKAKQKETLKTQKNEPISLSKPRAKVKHVSEKQKVINADISAAKLQVVGWAVDNNCYYCHSCGKTSVFLLDCSHRISIKQRPDLACDINNIKLECRFCHLNFEAERMETMTESNCFLEDMKYIYDNDSEKFQKLFYKLLDFYEANPTTKVKSIIKKIENFEETNILS